MNSKFHEIFHSVIIGAVSDGAGFRYAGHFVVLLGERWRRWWWWWFLLLLLGMLVLRLLLLGEEGAKGSTIFPLAQAPWAGLPSQAPQPRPLAPWPRPPSLGPTGPSLVKAGRMTDGRMDGQEFPLCSTGLRPLRGRCPASIRIYTQITFQQTSSKAGQGYRWPYIACGRLVGHCI